MSAFSSAWDLLKALSTEDLQQAARTGGIGMTPERRQAYTDAGLPLSTGGGFRTMPETEAQRIMRYQRTGSPEGMGFPIEDTTGYDAKGEDLAEHLHQDADTGGSLDMDDRLLDEYFKLTQGDSIDPMSDDEPPPQHPFQDELYPIPRSISDLTRFPDTKGRFAGRPNMIEDDRGRRRPNPDRIRIGELEEIQGRKTAANRSLLESHRNNQKEQNEEHLREYLNQLPENEQFENEHFPLSEFSRRGEAGASPSDQAFKVIQQRKDNAERMKQVQAVRQREMMMQRQRNKMKSKQPPKGRAGGRRPGEGKNAYKNRMRRQGGRR